MDFRPQNGLMERFIGSKTGPWLKCNGTKGERSGFWSESVAVGSEAFALAIQATLGIRGRGRDVVSDDDV